MILYKYWYTNISYNWLSILYLGYKPGKFFFNLTTASASGVILSQILATIIFLLPICQFAERIKEFRIPLGSRKRTISFNVLDNSGSFKTVSVSLIGNNIVFVKWMGNRGHIEWYSCIMFVTPWLSSKSGVRAWYIFQSLMLTRSAVQLFTVESKFLLSYSKYFNRGWHLNTWSDMLWRP